jgi:hypothetical protein
MTFWRTWSSLKIGISIFFPSRILGEGIDGAARERTARGQIDKNLRREKFALVGAGDWSFILVLSVLCSAIRNSAQQPGPVGMLALMENFVRAFARTSSGFGRKSHRGNSQTRLAPRSGWREFLMSINK